MNRWNKMTIIISARELRGITLFLLLLVMVIVFPLFLNIRSEETVSIEMRGENFMNVNINASMGERPGIYHKQQGDTYPVEIRNATVKELTGIGMPEDIARTLTKFRDRGKKFKSKADLKAVYGMTEELIEKISPLLIFQEETSFADPQRRKPMRKWQEGSGYKHKDNTYYQKGNKDPYYKELTGKKSIVSSSSISKKEWIGAGMPERLAATVVKYLSKGGSFKKPEDLFKLYGMDSIVYREILPYIEFPAVESQNSLKDSVVTVEEVYLNKSEVQDWMQLPGVGSSYAYRIISYREKLGGYYSKEQISEVYQLPDSLYERIQSYIVSDEFKPGLYINVMSLDELYSHPYIDYKSAKLIIAYRNQHGDFKDFRDLQKMFGLAKETLSKLEPYLVYQ